MDRQTATFGLVTPSHAPDFERCRLLVESVARFVSPESPHYLIVPRSDFALFEQLQSYGSVRLIEEERLLPWWVFRTRFSRKWRVNLLGLPVRGWIAQQICKLAVAEELREDVLVMIDSDVVFFRPLDLRDFVRGDQVRLFAEPGRGDAPDHYPWYRAAARLLGLPRRDYTGSGYIGNVITWRRDVALKLLTRVEATWRLPWRLVLSNQITVSEYVLYGVYCELVLGEQSGHCSSPENPILEYWIPEHLDTEGLRALISGAQDHHVALMVTAKAGIDVGEYVGFVRQLWAEG